MSFEGLRKELIIGTTLGGASLGTIFGVVGGLATGDWAVALHCTICGVATGITLGSSVAIATHLHNESELSF